MRIWTDCRAAGVDNRTGTRASDCHLRKRKRQDNSNCLHFQHFTSPVLPMNTRASAFLRLEFADVCHTEARGGALRTFLVPRETSAERYLAAIHCISNSWLAKGRKFRMQCGDNQLHRLGRYFADETRQPVVVQFGRRVIQ
jgi:hypothetical protein